MVDDRLQHYQTSENERHTAVQDKINTDITDHTVIAMATIQELNTHRLETNKIETTIRVTLENQYHNQVSEYRKHVKEFEDDQFAVHGLFLKHVAGPALDHIIDRLHNREYMRSLFLLDQRYGLSDRNLVAGNHLQTEIRNKIFKDTENLRVQLDNFELILNMFERINQALSDNEKILRLLHALSNGGIIQNLFQVQINHLFDPHSTYVPTFSEAHRKISLRLETLSSEVASMHLQPVSIVSKVKSEKLCIFR
jgi:hypothetical protein